MIDDVSYLKKESRPRKTVLRSWCGLQHGGDHSARCSNLMWTKPAEFGRPRATSAPRGYVPWMTPVSPSISTPRFHTCFTEADSSHLSPLLGQTTHERPSNSLLKHVFLCCPTPKWGGVPSPVRKCTGGPRVGGGGAPSTPSRLSLPPSLLPSLPPPPLSLCLSLSLSLSLALSLSLRFPKAVASR